LSDVTATNHPCNYARTPAPTQALASHPRICHMTKHPYTKRNHGGSHRRSTSERRPPESQEPPQSAVQSVRGVVALPVQIRVVLVAQLLADGLGDETGVAVEWLVELARPAGSWGDYDAPELRPPARKPGSSSWVAPCETWLQPWSESCCRGHPVRAGLRRRRLFRHRAVRAAQAGVEAVEPRGVGLAGRQRYQCPWPRSRCKWCPCRAR